MQFVRKHAGAIAGTAVGGLLFWLIVQAVSVQSIQAEHAGMLFGRRVPLARYAKSLESVSRQALLQHGDDYRQQVPSAELENRAWERLTFLEEARRAGIRVSDKEVVEEIASFPLFQTQEGQFDKKGYQYVIQYSLGTSPRNFEEEIRENLMIRKLIRAATEKLSVDEKEIEEEFLRREEVIHVSALAVLEEPLAREVAHAARQEPGRLEGIARQLGRPLTRAGPFKRTDPVQELGTSGSAFEPAFSAQPGELCPEPVRAGSGWLVVRLDEKQPADLTKLDEAGRDKLRKELQDRKKVRSYFDWYLDLLKRANLQKNPLPKP